MMRAEIIYNPYAGPVNVWGELNDVRDYLCRCGWQVTRHVTDRSNRPDVIAREAVSRGAQMVIAAGGDGTINAVVNGLVGTDAALGVLPVGTTNVWALQMGIPTMNPMLPGAQVSRLVAGLEKRLASPLPANIYRKVLLEAARVLVEGNTVPIDIGEIKGRYFLLWAGVGMDAAIIQNVTSRSKKVLGYWAYVMPTLDTVRQYSSTRIKMDVDGTTIEIKTPLVIVTNIQLYGGKMAVGAKARVDDGLLDVCVFKGDGLLTSVHQAIKMFHAQNVPAPGIAYYQCREISIESGHPLPVQLDGEPVTETPVTIRTVPSALKVVVPQNVPGNLFSKTSSVKKPVEAL